MIVWISRALALVIHDRQLAEHGGATGIRDEGLLESALARPRQLHAHGQPVPDLADLAAATAFDLAQNHPFVDGNKRMGAVACEVFIVLNGATLSAEDHELYPQYLGLSEGSLGEADFAAWLRPRIIAKAPGKVQESSPAYRP
jgi:death on curing protein